jgi:integrase/recombinase XerD
VVHSSLNQIGTLQSLEQDLQDGIDIRTLQKWMGHRDIASTMVYLKGVRNRDIQARLKRGSLAAFA